MDNGKGIFYTVFLLVAFVAGAGFLGSSYLQDRHEMQTQQQTIATLQAGVAARDATIANLSAQIAQLRKEAQSNQTRLLQTEAALKKASDQNAVLTLNAQDLTKKLEAVTALNQSLTGQNHDQLTKANGLQTQLLALQVENKNLRQQLSASKPAPGQPAQPPSLTLQTFLPAGIAPWLAALLFIATLLALFLVTRYEKLHHKVQQPYTVTVTAEELDHLIRRRRGK